MRRKARLSRAKRRFLLAIPAAVAAFLVARFAVALFLDAHVCAVGWLPGWWPGWASFCADDPGVRAARGLQVAGWSDALPLLAAAATFLLVGYPWRGR